MNTRPCLAASLFRPFCQGGNCASAASSRAAGVPGGGDSSQVDAEVFRLCRRGVSFLQLVARAVAALAFIQAWIGGQGPRRCWSGGNGPTKGG